MQWRSPLSVVRERMGEEVSFCLIRLICCHGLGRRDWQVEGAVVCFLQSGLAREQYRRLYPSLLSLNRVSTSPHLALIVSLDLISETLSHMLTLPPTHRQQARAHLVDPLLQAIPQVPDQEALEEELFRELPPVSRVSHPLISLSVPLPFDAYGVSSLSSFYLSYIVSFVWVVE